MATKPTNEIVPIAELDTNLPSTGLPNKGEPATIIQETGFDDEQVVTAEILNYIFDNHYEWLDYFNNVLDGQITAGDGLVSDSNTIAGGQELSLDYADKTTAEAGTDNVKAMTSLRVHQAATVVVPKTFSPSSMTISSNSTTLPNGLIMKWGKVNGEGSIPVTFPTAFPNECYTVSLTVVNGGSESTATYASLTSKSASGFTTYIDAQTAPVGAEWFAIGY